MHTSDALSQLYNFTDTPPDKDVIPLNFLQHITPNYIEHSYSHFVENLYIHKTKALDATPGLARHIFDLPQWHDIYTNTPGTGTN